jgi:hypothetical protein
MTDNAVFGRDRLGGESKEVRRTVPLLSTVEAAGRMPQTSDADNELT